MPESPHFVANRDISPHQASFASTLVSFFPISTYERFRWCQRPGLNRRPKAYESSALPLSYSGQPGKGRSFFSPASKSRAQRHAAETRPNCDRRAPSHRFTVRPSRRPTGIRPPSSALKPLRGSRPAACKTRCTLAPASTFSAGDNRRNTLVTPFSSLILFHRCPSLPLLHSRRIQFHRGRRFRSPHLRHHRQQVPRGG